MIELRSWATALKLFVEEGSHEQTGKYILVVPAKGECQDFAHDRWQPRVAELELIVDDELMSTADSMPMSNMDSVTIKGFRNRRPIMSHSRTSVTAGMAKVNEDGPLQMQARKSERMTTRRSSAKRGSDLS